ncbi:hypothetical protein [Plasticicumulans sp.]|uniref:hypothetical protein n=1 Tax=Plasticicumulans sp. TaxID=2307179 RepID=UPI0039612A89
MLENFDDEVVHRLRDREGALTAGAGPPPATSAAAGARRLPAGAVPRRWPDAGRRALQRVDRERAERENLHWLRLDAEPVRGWLEAARTASLPSAACASTQTAPIRCCDLDPLRGQSGWLVLERLVIDCIEPIEHLLLAGLTDAGTVIGSEVSTGLLRLAATVNGTPLPPLPAAGLDALLDAGVTKHDSARPSRRTSISSSASPTSSTAGPRISAWGWNSKSGGSMSASAKPAGPCGG